MGPGGIIQYAAPGAVDCGGGEVRIDTDGPTFTLWQVEDKLERQMCARGWSDQWGSPYIDCRASAATGGVRTVTWYDDANSTALKAGLAKRLGLGGVGVFTAEMAGAITEPLAQRTWGALTSLCHRAEGLWQVRTTHHVYLLTQRVTC